MGSCGDYKYFKHLTQNKLGMTYLKVLPAPSAIAEFKQKLSVLLAVAYDDYIECLRKTELKDDKYVLTVADVRAVLGEQYIKIWPRIIEIATALGVKLSLEQNVAQIIDKKDGEIGGDERSRYKDNASQKKKGWNSVEADNVVQTIDAVIDVDENLALIEEKAGYRTAEANEQRTLENELEIRNEMIDKMCIEMENISWSFGEIDLCKEILELRTVIVTRSLLMQNNMRQAVNNGVALDCLKQCGLLVAGRFVRGKPGEEGMAFIKCLPSSSDPLDVELFQARLLPFRISFTDYVESASSIVMPKRTGTFASCRMWILPAGFALLESVQYSCLKLPLNDYKPKMRDKMNRSPLAVSKILEQRHLVSLNDKQMDLLMTLNRFSLRELAFLYAIDKQVPEVVDGRWEVVFEMFSTFCDGKVDSRLNVFRLECLVKKLNANGYLQLLDIASLNSVLERYVCKPPLASEYLLPFTSVCLKCDAQLTTKLASVILLFKLENRVLGNVYQCAVQLGCGDRPTNGRKKRSFEELEREDDMNGNKEEGGFLCAECIGNRQEWIEESFSNDCCAHMGIRIGGAHQQVEETLNQASKLFAKLSEKNAKKNPTGEIPKTDQQQQELVQEQHNMNISGDECG
ncbi:unnamed protein product [Didymodactylos carnosus]|uniref:Uncharacterized protein n=1 Tax=Didymodactylos carnosus TaxID=1234261 RepID=A0A8S2I0Q4_9BILA|nr:unnamed protein product [Didymodactylos carnosus]CAF3703382.1 unnamed protein product [Didymodactylos carnosus]